MVKVSVEGVPLVTFYKSILRRVTPHGDGMFLVFRCFTIWFVFYFLWASWAGTRVPGVFMQVSTGVIHVILSMWRIYECFPLFELGGLLLLSFSVLRFALSFYFSWVYGRRLLGLLLWFRSPLASLSWWLSLENKSGGIPPVGMESFWSSGVLVSALSFDFPRIPEKRSAHLSSRPRFPLGEFTSS